MKRILGIKIGMTQLFDDGGLAIPVTIVKAGPCFVTQIKTKSIDGYTAVQLGFGETKPRKLNKSERGHLGLLSTSKKHPKRKKSMGVSPIKHIREFRVKNVKDFKLGQAITVEQFESGDRIDVTGQSKGRGFAGVVKRHGFAGGPKTHGQSDRWRAPGSIGATAGIARVMKGKRMAGRMGNERKTVQNLEIVRVDAERNLLAIRGSVPGAKGSLVIVKIAAKG